MADTLIMNPENPLKIFTVLFLLGLLLSPALSRAHKVNVFAYVEDSTIYIEGYFPDGRPVQKGGVEVLDSKGKVVFEGTTDTEGKLSFPVPVRDNLTIVLNAAMGHKDTFVLKKEELE